MLSAFHYFVFLSILSMSVMDCIFRAYFVIFGFGCRFLLGLEFYMGLYGLVEAVLGLFAGIVS